MSKTVISPKPIISVKQAISSGTKVAPDLLDNFEPKIQFVIENDDFTIRTASSHEDLHLALKLRHDVFLEEGLGKSHRSGMEFDSLDAIADHLMIIDNSTGNAIGTYRLIDLRTSGQCFSETEFVLDDFFAQEGNKLEMGRACTHPKFRTGRTVDLLWKGLSKYIELSNTHYLFGCSSLFSEDFNEVFSIAKTLHAKKKLLFHWNIQARPPYDIKMPDRLYDQAKEKSQILRDLPPLFRSYLHAGAIAYGYPSFDKVFRCVDFFTVLNLRSLNKKFQERYLPNYPEKITL